MSLFKKLKKQKADKHKKNELPVEVEQEKDDGALPTTDFISENPVVPNEQPEPVAETSKPELKTSLGNLKNAFFDVGKTIMNTKAVSEVKKSFDEIDALTNEKIEKVKGDFRKNDDK